MSSDAELPPTVPWDLLERSLTDTLRIGDQARLDAWLASDPAHARFAETVRGALAESDPDAGTPDVARIVVGVERRVQVAAPVRPGTRLGANPGRAARVSHVRAYAAAGVGAAILLVWGAATSLRDRAGAGDTDDTLGTHTYTTTSGQRARVVLADGTRLTLAPQTTVTVAQRGGRFNHGTRDVTLRGEAHFDVVAGSRTPFVVRAGDVRVEVLGTAFDVRRYDDDATTRVAVTTGKVAVTTTRPDGATRRPVVLAAGTVGRVTDSTVVASTRDDAGAYARWTDGTLVFRDVPVSEVLTTLGRWYDLDFRVSDPALARDRLSVTIAYGDRADMLVTLKTLLDVRMTFAGKVVTLEPRRGSRSTLPRHDGRDSLTSHNTPEVGR